MLIFEPRHRAKKLLVHLQEEHVAQVDLLTAVHADQEALIADVSEQLSACRARCAELEATLTDLCGPSHAVGDGSEGYPTRAAELQAAEGRVARLVHQLAQTQVDSSVSHWKSCAYRFPASALQ